MFAPESPDCTILWRKFALSRIIDSMNQNQIDDLDAVNPYFSE
jgi:hypothetical protein